MTSEYEDAIAQIKKLEAELDGLRSTISEVQNLMPDVSAAAALASENVQAELRKNEQSIISRVDGRMRTERSARLLETARLRAGSAVPDRMLVILTPQRTGSTLLMDAFPLIPV